MFSRNISIFIMIASILIDKSNSLSKYSNSNRFECLIGNNKYIYEYLSGSNDHFPTIDHLVKKNNYRHVVYSIHQLTLRNISNIKWTFIQINQTSDKYYLKNKMMNEYLCACDLPDELGRRNVQSVYIRYDEHKINMNKIRSSCMWKLERTLSDNYFNSYIIKNVYYDESLFSAITKTTKYKRNVYLWNKNPANDKYKWIIDC
jgi:hypothetical protein